MKQVVFESIIESKTGWVQCQNEAYALLRVKKWHEDCPDGTHSKLIPFTSCCICETGEVAQLLWEGPNEDRPSKESLRQSLLKEGQNLFPWYNPEGKIGHCALGEVTVCGNCRLGKQRWVIQKIQLGNTSCICRTCNSCKERLMLLGSRCACTFRESKLELCNRCDKLEEQKWVQTVSKKEVWLTRKSILAMGCVAQGMVMTSWVSNPLPLMEEEERAWLYRYCSMSGLYSPSYTDPLEEGSVLGQILKQITCLDVWERVVLQNLNDRDKTILIKRKGQYVNSTVEQFMINEIKNMNFNIGKHNWETRAWEHGVRETDLTMMSRSQIILSNEAWYKIKYEERSASVLKKMTVSLCCTRGFMGMGFSMQGMKIEWKTENKPIKEKVRDWLFQLTRRDR